MNRPQILEIVEQFFSDQKNNVVINEVLLQHTAEIKVSALLKLIEGYKNNYFESGEIPDLSNPFHKNIKRSITKPSPIKKILLKMRLKIF